MATFQSPLLPQCNIRVFTELRYHAVRLVVIADLAKSPHMWTDVVRRLNEMQNYLHPIDGSDRRNQRIRVSFDSLQDQLPQLSATHCVLSECAN
jgi:hypothetical protein